MKLVTKPETYLDLGAYDVVGLRDQVGRLPDSFWQIEDQRKENKFEVFHHTRHVIFRFTPGNEDPRSFYSNPAWTIWEKTLRPLMDQITAQYNHNECVYSKVMLARLLAGHSIDRHVDGAGSNLLTHKVHVPLITNPKALFYIEGEVRHLETGRAYEVNNIVRHAAENKGTEDRIHLIFEHFDAR